MRGKTAGLVALAALLLAGAKQQTLRLDVTRLPEDARVFVDGKRCATLQGTSSCTVTTLGKGRHLLHIEAPFRRSRDEYVRLDESTPFVEVDGALDVERGLVLVKTKPDGVDVACDGKSLGTTPLLLKTLPCGPVHTLELSRNGYQTKRVEVRMEDRTPVVLREEMVLDSGMALCMTEPAGATVFVDGVKQQGVTPLEVMIPRGGAVVTLHLDGYQDAERSISIPAGERREIKERLKGRPARLSVVTEPDRAKVYLDGNFQGTSPASCDLVPPGSHEIRVELSGYAPATRTVDLASGGEATEKFKLESVLGRLEVITSPAGAKISIDGKAAGLTRQQGDSEKSHILMIENVTAGEHAVFAHLDGYLDVSRKVTLDAKETKQLYIALKRNFTPDTEVETINGAPVRGVLMQDKTNAEQIVLELKPGVERTIMRDTIRKITNLKE